MNPTLSKYGLPLIVLLAFLFSFYNVVKPLPKPVSDSEWSEAEKVIHNKANDDSIVIVHPAWEDGALKHFKKNFLILGKPNNGIQEFSQQVWVILSHGAKRPDYLPNLKIDFEKQLDEIEILRYVDADAEHILYDFFYKIPEAEVKLYSKDQTRDCKWKDEKWVCPIRDWNYLGKRSVQIGKKWQYAIWMHPIKNWTTSATYKNVPMGKRLVGEYALSDQAAELKTGTPVDFVIKINGVEKARMKTERTYGWHTFELDTSYLNGQNASVSFEVSTINDGLRHFSFMARTRDDEVGSKRSRTFEKPVPVKDKKEIKDSKEEREKEKEDNFKKQKEKNGKKQPEKINKENPEKVDELKPIKEKAVKIEDAKNGKSLKSPKKNHGKLSVNKAFRFNQDAKEKKVKLLLFEFIKEDCIG